MSVLSKKKDKYGITTWNSYTKQHSQLTYFHLPHPIFFSNAICWGVNYINLSPHITHEWKCFLYLLEFPSM